MGFLLQHPASWLLLSYGLVGAALQQSGGLYDPLAFAFVAGGFVACMGAWAVMVRHPERMSDTPPTAFAAVILAASLLYIVLSAPVRGIYVTSYAYHWFSFLSLLSGVAAAGVMVMTKHRRRSSLRTGTWLFTFCCGALMLVLMPVVSPTPRIDVHYMMQTVSERFLDGENPYVTQFSDLYEGKGSSKPLTTFTYPPGNLVLTIPFFALFGDVRFGLLAALVLWLWTVWKFSKDGTTWAQVLLLLGVLHPRIQFVLEQGWVDPLILGALSLALLLHEAGKERLSALTYGVFLGLKQYLVFFLPHFWLLERNPRSWLRLGLGGIALFVPFFLWDFDATLQNGILFHLEDTFRGDSLTLVSALHPFTHWEPSRGWSLLVGAVFCALTLWTCKTLPRMQGFLLASTVTTFAVFFLGSQAFGNYYFLVSGLQLLLLSRAGRA